jgi:hypothetical protein
MLGPSSMSLSLFRHSVHMRPTASPTSSHLTLPNSIFERVPHPLLEILPIMVRNLARFNVNVRCGWSGNGVDRILDTTAMDQSQSMSPSPPRLLLLHKYANEEDPESSSAGDEAEPGSAYKVCTSDPQPLYYSISCKNGSWVLRWDSALIKLRYDVKDENHLLGVLGSPEERLSIFPHCAGLRSIDRGMWVMLCLS